MDFFLPARSEIRRRVKKSPKSRRESAAAIEIVEGSRQIRQTLKMFVTEIYGFIWTFPGAQSIYASMPFSWRAAW